MRADDEGFPLAKAPHAKKRTAAITGVNCVSCREPYASRSLLMSRAPVCVDCVERYSLVTGGAL